MKEPTFRELLALRSKPGDEIADRFGAYTHRRFNHERGIPLVVGTLDGRDFPLLLASLGRSSIALSPTVVNNAPNKTGITELALKMGARVIDEPIAGQMSAQRTGLQAALAERPQAPILITDDDCLVQKHWAVTMLRKTRLEHNIGGIAYGGVVLDHGPSVVADTLRTGYALGFDTQSRFRHDTPKARGANGLLQPDINEAIMANLMEQPANAFPCDLVIRDSVIDAGGAVISVADPRAIVFSRGDRFDGVTALLKDVLQRGERRIELYPEYSQVDAPNLNA